jgi:hypothetical protein
MTFRDRLIATIQAARPVLEDPGVLVVGSEVPNLLEPGAAATPAACGSGCDACLALTPFEEIA